MTSYIDIHTHRSSSPETIAVHLHDPTSLEPSENEAPFFYGVHPWKATQFDKVEFEKGLVLSMQSPHFLGLGEVGLDRACDINLQTQQHVFAEQLEIAQKCSVKRIVLHSVKAYDDLWPLLETSSFLQILWHDYNGSADTTKRLLKDKRCWFSYGKGLFRNKSRGLESLKMIPLNRLFWETDDSGVEIEAIYQRASELLEIDVNDLIEQMKVNWEYFKC